MRELAVNARVKDGTLRLKSPFLKTASATVFILIAFLIIGEVITRQKFFQSPFVAAGIGSPNRQFEKQLGRLKWIIAREGKVDCIITGSSTVQEGFDPVLFRSAFEEKTGEELTCFNFGVDGLTAVGAGVVAQVLVEMYHPQIFIYGTDPRDYTYPMDSLENSIILDSPWIKYQLGQSNILGWLFEHSFLLQYQEPLRELLHLHFYRELQRYQDWREAAQWGYLEISTVRVSVSEPITQNMDNNYIRVYYELFSNYQVYPENLIGLEQVASQQENGVQVLIVEMPVAPGYMDFFPNGSKDYDMYITKVSQTIESNQVLFLRPQPSISIPIDGWTDHNHLNKEGTKIFSEWLGMKLGEISQGKSIRESGFFGEKP